METFREPYRLKNRSRSSRQEQEKTGAGAAGSGRKDPAPASCSCSGFLDPNGVVLSVGVGGPSRYDVTNPAERPARTDPESRCKNQP